MLVKKFIEAVEKYGPMTAVVDSPDGKTLRRTSFDELMKLSRQVAGYIQSRCIAPQSFITIELSASVEFLAAEMGVWMARCVAVPMGPAFPEKRKNYISNHCDAVLNLDSVLMESIRDDAPLADIAEPDETDDALIIYTSGSTGTPKGILHDYGSVSEVIRMFGEHAPTPDDRFAAGIPSYFVAAGFFWGLVYGTEIHILPVEINKDVARMAEYHRQNGITRAFVSATVLPLYRCTAPTIRIITGSDRVVCRELPPYIIDNSYGMSETMGPVIFTVITEPTENAPIGLPVDGVEFAILDDDLNPVPQGVEGEICLKGHFCKGYFKDEERTRQLFRGGWLHTGDLGYVLPDGRIQFVSRMDWMVKVNGQRVEPGEVEASMRSIDGITRAVVKGFEGNNGSNYLVGYYTVSQDSHLRDADDYHDHHDELSEQSIRSHLEKMLPSYMVPSFFVQMETFPLNANGKIDRKSLKAPIPASLTADYVAPRNEVEETLCLIMAKVLQLPRVGIDDNFMALGGDSIKMMEFQQECSTSDIELLQGISIPVIYSGGSVRNIAEQLTAPNSSTSKNDKPQMEYYPLNKVQKRVFAEPKGGMRSNVPQLFRLDKEIDRNRLTQAIMKAYTAHKALFTRFSLNDSGEPRQKMVVEPFDIPVEQLSQAEFEETKKSLVKPFDLMSDRLFRVRLFEVKGDDNSLTNYIFFDIHHIIIDGTSYQILFRDIDRAYRGLDLEEEDWNMAEMATLETIDRDTDIYQNALKWNQETLSPERSVDGGWGEGKMRMTHHPLNIPLDEMEQFCRANGVTTSVLSMAAYALLIGSYSGKDDFSFATVFSGREDARLRNSVGLFAHRIWMRAGLENNTPCSDFIRNIGSSMFLAEKNSFVSNEDIAPAVKKMGRVVFLFQGEMLKSPQVGGHPIAKEILPGLSTMAKDSALFTHIYVQREANRLLMGIFYVDSWRDEDYIRRMAIRYTQCLRGLMNAHTVGDAICSVPQEDMFPIPQC